MIAWSRGSSKLDAEPEQRLSPDFDAFVRALEVDRTPAKGLAYFAAPFSGNGNGNGHGHRGKETVLPVEFLILDLDTLTPESEPDLLDWLKSFRGASWRTHSSTEQKPKRCALLQLARPATRTECIAINKVIARDAKDAIGVELDTAQFKPEQPRYMPPVGAAFARFWGEPINVDLYLTLLPPPEAPRAALVGDETVIAEGGRNAALTSLAGKLRRIGLSGAELEASLRECNRQRCRPPLSDADIAVIARSVARYEPVAEKETPSGFSGKSPSDLQPRLTGMYLVKGVLPSLATVQVFGEPNCGKSAVMLDLACHLGSGRAYHAGRIKPCPVAYFALENPISIENRVLAWCRHYSVAPHTVRVLIARGELNLLNAVSVETAIAFLQAQPERFGLVVLDTQARATPGANENASEDISLMVRHVDRLRDVLGCTVALIHHCGKTPGLGARGHSSQLGAVDASIEIADRQLIVRKGRDLASPPALAFRLIPLELGKDEDDDAVTVVVAQIEPRPDIPAPKRTRFTGFPGIAMAAFSALVQSGAARRAPHGHSAIPSGADYVHLEDWKKEFCRSLGSDTPGRQHKAFWDAKAALLKAGAIRVKDDLVWRVATNFSDD
jgi:AAA domain/Primase C terminal 1 (PriCT-1)